MTIGKKSIKHVQKLTFLGLTINKNKCWTEHVNYIRKKLSKQHNSGKLTAKNWGIRPQILKVWYLKSGIVERIIFHYVDI